MARNNASVKSVTSGLLVARGVAAILFGIFALAWPGLTVATFVIFVMVWLIVSGVALLVEAFMSVGRGGWTWLSKLAVGGLQIGVGAYLVQRPELTVATLVALVALVLVVQGVIDVVMTFIGDENTAVGRVSWLVGGLLSVAVGLVIWQYPVEGTLAFVWVLGLLALINGPLYIAMAIDTKNS